MTLAFDIIKQKYVYKKDLSPNLSHGETIPIAILVPIYIYKNYSMSLQLHLTSLSTAFGRNWTHYWFQYN